jgi:hypothetical protein
MNFLLFCFSSLLLLDRSLVKDDMALYQHSAHCPSAIQWFLDENPEYWPFIPIEESSISSSSDDSNTEKSEEIAHDNTM